MVKVENTVSTIHAANSADDQFGWVVLRVTLQSNVTSPCQEGNIHPFVSDSVGGSHGITTIPTARHQVTGICELAWRCCQRSRFPRECRVPFRARIPTPGKDGLVIRGLDDLLLKATKGVVALSIQQWHIDAEQPKELVSCIFNPGGLPPRSPGHAFRHTCTVEK